ncbi:DUF3192 domain-containing protein [Thalassotalea litorea]|uniref:DUF3192 domain-containing protein n=1 Tax=Thalassotalea litorea TaxID=2020715 RepID=A0A5R9IPW8_9GAMM|nr:DUF3192 domain-containing protein [Thalassotalea litorea]TLU67584.1 DUF3192 domain-containing protein [Thalassotalea litorea]
MKKTLVALLVMAPLSVALTGCVIAVDGKGDWDAKTMQSSHDAAYDNRKNLAELEENMSFSAVKKKMGVPDFNEVYDKDGESIQVLYYRTNRKHADSMTTKDECTPLIFKNNVLVSWGDKALNQI